MYDKVKRMISKSATNMPSAIRYFEPTYITIIYIKYLCDNNLIDYKCEDITNEIYLDIVNNINKDINRRIMVYKLDMNKLFSLIKDIPVTDLIDEIFKKHENEVGINLFPEDSKKVCYLRGYDFNCYDPKGNTLYLNYIMSDDIAFMLLDRMLGINNSYDKDKSSDWKKPVPKDIDNVYIYNKVAINRLDAQGYYTSMKKLVHDCLREKKDIIINTNYKTISTMDKLTFTNNLSKIIINSKREKNESFLIYKPKSNHSMTEEKTVSIILYDSDKIKNVDQLKKIIDEDKENKENLIKITYQDFLDNNCRIGFKIYSTEKAKEYVKTINEIVDQNRKLIDKLNNIDYTIGSEIDNLINR